MLTIEGTIKIVDFGNSFKGWSEEFCGTLEYIAPEVVQ